MRKPRDRTLISFHAICPWRALTQLKRDKNERLFVVTVNRQMAPIPTQSVNQSIRLPGSWQAQMWRRAASANSSDDIFRTPSFLKLQIWYIIGTNLILLLDYYGTLIGNPNPGIQWYNFRPPGVTPNRGMGSPWGAFCQITLTSCS